MSESVIAEVVEDSQVDHGISSHIVYSRRVLGLSGGQTALLANGRVRKLYYTMSSCYSFV